MKRASAVFNTVDALISENPGDWTVSILAVGDPTEWLSAGYDLPAEGDIAFAAFHDIDTALLDRLAPPVILSPLLANGFDCIDLAEVLMNADYRGKYRAVSKKLPRPELVTREISQLCPTLDFDILQVD